MGCYWPNLEFFYSLLRDAIEQQKAPDLARLNSLVNFESKSVSDNYICKRTSAILHNAILKWTMEKSGSYSSGSISESVPALIKASGRGGEKWSAIFAKWNSRFVRLSVGQIAANQIYKFYTDTNRTSLFVHSLKWTLIYSIRFTLALLLSRFVILTVGWLQCS